MYDDNFLTLDLQFISIQVIRSRYKCNHHIRKAILNVARFTLKIILLYFFTRKSFYAINEKL